MNKLIGLAGILLGIGIFIFQKELILSVSLILIGIIFMIFNKKEEEIEKRIDEK